MKIAIYGRTLNENNISYVQQLFDVLANKKCEVFIYDEYCRNIEKHIQIRQSANTFIRYEEIINKADFFFSLGGDGTLLDTLPFVRNSNIPILGFNFGRLGFLAGIGKEAITKAVDDIEKGSFILDKRSLLHLESNKPIFGELNFALNDFTIHKKDTSSVITIHTYINGDYINTYWCDGLIVATPTGSTGYSLSCGGPIVFPASENFVITPVAAHNLNSRPLIVSNNSEISFKVEGRSEQFICTLDSRFEMIDPSTVIKLRKECFSINLVQLKGESFANTLRNKMNWGLDRRN